MALKECWQWWYDHSQKSLSSTSSVGVRGMFQAMLKRRLIPLGNFQF